MPHVRRWKAGMAGAATTATKKAMAANHITIHAKPRWWLRYYLRTLAFMCWLTGSEPRPDRLAYWLTKGTKVWIR